MTVKQPVAINFARGIDSKTDPWQIAIGAFLAMENSVFTTTGRLTKRNGFGTIPATGGRALTTFSGALVALQEPAGGSQLQVYTPSTQTSYINATPNFTMFGKTTVLPLLSNTDNQTQSDCIIAASGVGCVVFTNVSNASGSLVTTYRFMCFDSATGQQLTVSGQLSPEVTLNTGTATSAPRVFLLGNYFIIVYTSVSGGVTSLRYLPVATSNLVVGTDTQISTNYVPNTAQAFDGFVLGSNLWLAWASIDEVVINQLSSALVLGTPMAETIATPYTVAMVSVTADVAASFVYVSVSDGTTIHGLGLSSPSVVAFGPKLITTTTGLSALTSCAHNGSCSIYYEILNNYSYDASIPTHFVDRIPVSSAGTVGTAQTLMRSVGLASKAIVYNNLEYVLSIYFSAYQPSYFLIQSIGAVSGILPSNIAMVGRLAYSNGGGYCATGLPAMNLSGITLYSAYLYKDLLVPVNKTVNSQVVTGFYNQLGVRLASFQTAQANTESFAEIANNLHINGSLLQAYDGVLLTEHGFNYWPDLQLDADGTYHGISTTATTGAMSPQPYNYQVCYEWTDAKGNLHRSAPSIPVPVTVKSTGPGTFTATFAAGSKTLTATSSTAGFFVGQFLTDSTTPASIPDTAYITDISGSTITISQATTAASAGSPGDTLTTNAAGTVTIDIPTLRITAKPDVRIVIYRWSVANPVPYQITSVLSPLFNDPTVDSVSYLDIQNDNVIVGNEILYTEGGVVENIGAPAILAMTNYKTRLIGIDGEDPNTIWYSQPGAQNTPVEFSDELTQYIPPATSGLSSGPLFTIGTLDDKLILGKKNSIFYMTGQGPDPTGANNDFSDAILITSAVGCTNQQSILIMPNGIMFQASNNQGIWLLGRDLSCTYIGAPMQQYNAFNVTSAANIPGLPQVRFTLSNGLFLVYDYFVGQWDVFTSLAEIYGTLFQNLHTYTDGSFVYQETPGLYLDGDATIADNATPVTMSFKTGWINVAGLQGYERAYFFYLLGEYLSPHTLTVNIYYDYETTIAQTDVITPDASNPESYKVHFKRQLCEAFQIEVIENDNSAGAGLTLSGLNMIVGLQKAYRPQPAKYAVG